MKTFKQHIDEAFDKPYPIKVMDAGDNWYIAKTKIDDGSEIEVTFYEHMRLRKKMDGTVGLRAVWEIAFSRNVTTSSRGANGKRIIPRTIDRDDITGMGDAMRIFATVIDAIKQFIKKQNPNHLVFTALKGDITQGNIDSREKLYSRLVSRFAKQNGFDFKITSFGADGSVFSLTKKNPKIKKKRKPKR